MAITMRLAANATGDDFTEYLNSLNGQLGALASPEEKLLKQKQARAVADQSWADMTAKGKG